MFEDLALAAWGNRLPQLSFEVFRPVADPDTAVGMISSTHVSLATGIALQSVAALAVGDTVRMLGSFRVADGFFAAERTALWSVKVG